MDSREVRTSLVSQMVKHLPTMWETWVQVQGREDLLEKEMATHSSILAWKIPWREAPTRGRKEWDMTERLHFHFLSREVIKEKKQRDLGAYCVDGLFFFFLITGVMKMSLVVAGF